MNCFFVNVVNVFVVVIIDVVIDVQWLGNDKVVVDNVDMGFLQWGVVEVY